VNDEVWTLRNCGK